MLIRGAGSTWTSSATAAHCYPWMDMCVYLENGGLGRPVDGADRAFADVRAGRSGSSPNSKLSYLIEHLVSMTKKTPKL